LSKLNVNPTDRLIVDSIFDVWYTAFIDALTMLVQNKPGFTSSDSNPRRSQISEQSVAVLAVLFHRIESASPEFRPP